MHDDGFIPFRGKEHHVTYRLVQLMADNSFSATQASVRPWFVVDGPQKLKSTEPMRLVCLSQAKAAFEEGVEVQWPTESSVVYGEHEEEQKYGIGMCNLRLAIALVTCDQPAAATANGHMGHNALMACKVGAGEICKGKRAGGREGILKKGKTESSGTTEVTNWHMYGSEDMEQQCHSDNVLSQEEVLAALETLDEAPNMAQFNRAAAKTGWKERTLMADLAQLYGFD